MHGRVVPGTAKQLPRRPSLNPTVENPIISVANKNFSAWHRPGRKNGLHADYPPARNWPAPITWRSLVSYFAGFLLFVVVSLFSWTSAYAYIDAATGSMILQVVLGGIAGALVFLKLYWHRLKGFFGIKSKEQDEPDSSAS